MDRGFVKDVLSIALGGFVGVSLAYSWGSAATFGFLVGGALGYLARLLTEPRRIAHASRIAWQHTTTWRPHPEWRMKVKDTLWKASFVAGISGFIMGIFIGIILTNSTDRIFSSNLYWDCLSWYVATVLTVNAVTFFFGMLVAFGSLFTSTPADRPNSLLNDRWMAVRLNLIAIHFTLVFYTGYACFLGIKALTKSPAFFKHYGPPVAKALYTFAKVFVKIVHSDAFTTCAIYAILTGICIFLFVYPFWYLTLPSAIIGGTIGAIMRRVVLRPIPSLVGGTI